MECAYIIGAIVALCQDLRDRFNPLVKWDDLLSCLYRQDNLHHLVVDSIALLDTIRDTDKTAYTYYRDNLSALCNDLVVASFDEESVQKDEFWKGYYATVADACMALDFNDPA